jgi:two-component system CheB/CheR fusion protein
MEDFEVEQIFPVIGKRSMCLNARQIDNVNGEQLILLAIEDITDKRKIEHGLAEVERLLNESKERLKFAVDSAGLGTWDYAPQTKELVLDKRCREIFGLLPSAPITIDVFLEKIHPDDRTRVESNIRETLHDINSGEFDIEFRTIAISEKNKWLKAKGRAYFNEHGVAIRFIGTLLDITVQKLIDEATRELLSKKDEFISIASHELKTPVTSLKAVLQILERTTLDKEEMKSVHAFVQKANKQVDKLTELIKDLLDVTKIQAGKLELKRTGFILGELIEECWEGLQANTLQHSILLEGEVNVEIYADRNRLEQVLVNLISNAIKYSPESDKVIITVEKLAEGVKIAITDFGIGIAQDKIPLLFDRFYRVDENSQRYTGLGLGLFISAEIVKQHQGHIYVESKEGKGSTFWFTIPK